MKETLIVVGAGHAAGQAVTSLRAGGFDGSIVLVGDEPHVPYERPPLSKQFLAGEMELDRLYFKPPAFYESAEVELLLGRRVEGLDRTSKTVTLDDGGTLGYDKLLLSTGSRVRRLELPGADLDGIFYLRNIADVEAVRSRLEAGRRLVIVGGGYIGLEVAAVARRRGLEVTVLEMAPHLMSRVVAAEVADFFEGVHREKGVDVRTGVGVEGFAGNGKVERVLCSGGGVPLGGSRGGIDVVEADFVVVGVGIVPNTELAEASGLECAPREEGGGLRVDENARTADPSVWAAGDCANHPNELLGRNLRLESVHNAIEQAKAAAAAICGDPRPYHQVPWFWSDQYDLKLQIAGLSTGADQVVLRGRPESGSFAACYLKDGVLVAVDAVSSPRDFMASRRLLASKPRISPERLADVDVPLKDMI